MKISLEEQIAFIEDLYGFFSDSVYTDRIDAVLETLENLEKDKA